MSYSSDSRHEWASVQLLHYCKLLYFHIILQQVMVNFSAGGLLIWLIVVVVVALLFYVHGKHLRSCRDGQLT